MKWRGRRGSSNIQDRRRSGGATRRSTGGNRGSLRTGGRGRGGQAGGLGLIAVVVIGLFLGVDLGSLLGDGQGLSMPQGEQRELTAADEEAAQMVSVVLADTEEVWADLMPQQFGQAYAPATLVLFAGSTRSQCGEANAASGPFYCPPEQAIYLDTQFFTTMEQRLNAGGDFAAAYVVAHEVAHHVQNEMGILSQVNRQRAQVDEATSNRLSVMIELQADCFSGIWAREAQRRFDILEAGDLEEALNAAWAIGDDTLQRNAGQRVRPHTFTHGTSEQRQRWFAQGFQTGDIRQCNTFEARQL